MFGGAEMKTIAGRKMVGKNSKFCFGLVKLRWLLDIQGLCKEGS